MIYTKRITLTILLALLQLIDSKKLTTKYFMGLKISFCAIGWFKWPINERSNEMSRSCLWTKRIIEGLPQSHCHVEDGLMQLQSRPLWRLMGKTEPRHYGHLTRIKASKTSELPITQLLTFQWHQQEIQERDEGEQQKQWWHSLHTLVWLFSLNPHKWEAVVRQPCL